MRRGQGDTSQTHQQSRQDSGERAWAVLRSVHVSFLLGLHARLAAQSAAASSLEASGSPAAEASSTFTEVAAAQAGTAAVARHAGIPAGVESAKSTRSATARSGLSEATEVLKILICALGSLHRREGFGRLPACQLLPAGTVHVGAIGIYAVGVIVGPVHVIDVRRPIHVNRPIGRKRRGAFVAAVPTPGAVSIAVPSRRPMIVRITITTPVTAASRKDVAARYEYIVLVHDIPAAPVASPGIPSPTAVADRRSHQHPNAE